MRLLFLLTGCSLSQFVFPLWHYSEMLPDSRKHYVQKCKLILHLVDVAGCFNVVSKFGIAKRVVTSGNCISFSVFPYFRYARSHTKEWKETHVRSSIFLCYPSWETKLLAAGRKFSIGMERKEPEVPLFSESIHTGLLATGAESLQVGGEQSVLKCLHYLG